MALKDLPIWPFEPDWNEGLGETLEWKTDILQSPTGSEQRRALRLLPLRTFDFTVALDGAERSMLDNLIMAHSGDDWYLPLWHDVRMVDGTATASHLPIKTRNIPLGTAMLVLGETPFDYEVTEFVQFAEGGGMNVSPPLSRVPRAGTRLFPMIQARLVEEPSQTAITDTLITAEPQFIVTDYSSDIPAPTAAEAGLTSSYRGFHVLTRESDWSERGERGQQRLLDTFDAGVGAPEQHDTAGRPFPTQQHRWVLDGYEDHTTFQALLHWLRGRCVPVWVPTWMGDMRLISAVSADATSIQVERCGFTLAGGPRPEREDIMIELMTGARIYRRITGSGAGVISETIQLDSAVGTALSPQNVLRICFVSLMRLDHDTVEINHITDLEGVSEAALTFRAAPNSRVVEAGF